MISRGERSAIHVAIIGLGKMGVLHSGIMNSLPGCRVIAASEPQSLVRNYFSKISPKIKCYSDYRNMLQREDIDIAVITTPTYLHSEIGKECAKSGVDILVEKPFGTTRNDARNLLEAVQSSKIISEVGYACVKFTRTFQKAYQILRSEALGPLIDLTASAFVTQVSKPSNSWQFVPAKSGGGVLNNFASHLVYLLYWYFGKPTSVTCETHSTFSQMVEDEVHATLQFDSQTPTLTFDASWTKQGYPMPEFTLTAKGENGSLTVSDFYVELSIDRTRDEYPAGSTKLFRQDLWEGVDYLLGDPEFCREDRHLVDSVIKNEQTSVDAQVGYDVQNIIESMYDSNASGRPCEIAW